MSRLSPEDSKALVELKLSRAGITTRDEIAAGEDLIRKPAVDFAVRELILKMLAEINDPAVTSNSRHAFRAIQDIDFDIPGRVCVKQLPPAMEKCPDLVKAAIDAVLKPASSDDAGALIRREKSLGLRFFDLEMSRTASELHLRRVEPSPNRFPVLCNALLALRYAERHPGHKNKDADLVRWEQVDDDVDPTYDIAPHFIPQGWETGRRLIAVPKAECQPSDTIRDIAHDIKQALLQKLSRDDIKRLGL